MRGSPFANHLFQTFRDSDKLYLQLEIKTSLYRLPENLAALELRFIGKVKKGRLGATLLLQLHGQKLHLLLDKRDKELMVVSPPSLPFLHRLYSCEHTSWRQTPI